MIAAEPTRALRLATLWLVAALHAFTHVYQLALVPLYLEIRHDLQLASDWQATLLVTLQSLTYCGASLPLGVLADKISRKWLMSAGLLLNALGFLGLAFAPSYGWALACVAVSGLFGSFYHPPASALIMSLFPDRVGWALGRTGMGASLGFFVGPLYAGWRAQSAGWRQPCLELAIAGVVMAVLFQMFAREPARHVGSSHVAAQVKSHRTRDMGPLLAAVGLVALAFMLRDFGASGMTTLSSLFLQRAHGYGPKMAGFFIGLMYLVGMLSNPLLGSFSDRRRFTAIAMILLSAASCAVVVPWLPHAWVWVGLCAYGFCILSSYPVVEAALLESVPDTMRGRTFGMFLTVNGIIASLAHWAMGRVADALRERALTPEAYVPWFIGLAALIASGLLGVPAIRRLRRLWARDGVERGG